MKTFFGAAMPALIIALCWSSLAAADGSGDPAAVKEEDGKYFDKEGNPTYKVQADGTRRLVYVFRLSPLPFRLPCLPWTGWHGLVLCPRSAETP